MSESPKSTASPFSTCAVCKRPSAILESFHGEVACSDFCYTTSDDEQRKWLAMKPGDFGVFPCAECGIAVEDEYAYEAICDGCGPKRTLLRLQDAEAELALIRPVYEAASAWVDAQRAPLPPLSTCDFVGDSGCSNPDCARCHGKKPNLYGGLCDAVDAARGAVGSRPKRVPPSS